DEQAEARVQVAVDLLGVFPGGFVAGEETRNELTAPPDPGLRPQVLAAAGDGRETARAGRRAPGPAGLQAAAADHAWRVRPARARGRGALVDLVAIGGQHQPIVGMRLPREHDQAHETTVSAAARDGDRAPRASRRSGGARWRDGKARADSPTGAP